MDQPTRARTHSNTLHLELLATDSLLRQHDVHPRDVATVLLDLGWICGLARAVTVHLSEVEQALEEADRWEPRIARVRYGSPLGIVIDLPAPLLKEVAAMSLVIYSVKRLWKLPLEFKTHDRKVRAKYLEADRKAKEAEQARDKAYLLHRQQRHEFLAGMGKRPSKRGKHLHEFESRWAATRDESFRVVDQESGWPPGTVSELEDRDRASWEAESAVWFAEDDDG